MRRNSPDQLRLIIAMLTLTSFLLAPALNVPARTTKQTGSHSTTTRSASKANDAANKIRVGEAYGKLPLSFEPNRGQTDRRVKFLSHGSGYTLFLTTNEAVLSLPTPDSGPRNEKAVGPSPDSNNSHSAASDPQKSSVLRMRLVGANRHPKIEGQEQLPGRSNYLIGSDRAEWHTDIPTFAQVRITSVYPGIDVIYYGQQRQLEYDFRLAAGADASKIRIAFEGAENLSIDAEGNLILKTGGGDIIQHAPVIYQESQSGKQSIAGRYVLRGGNEVGFEVATYNRSQPLVIDPQLIYSTYYGGTGLETGQGIAVDQSGNVYITGRTDSTNLPVVNALSSSLNLGDNTNPHSSDAFVMKLNATGTALIYSTYLGGNRGDIGFGIAVLSDGKAAIAGAVGNYGCGSHFPTTSTRFQGEGLLCGGITERADDVFVTVLTFGGNDLFYSTYYGGTANILKSGGNDDALAIAVDSADKIYVTGATTSNDLPTKNAFQASRGGGDLSEDPDGFIAKFDPTKSGNDSLVFASYLGGSGDDAGNGIAVDSVGNAYVVGETLSGDLPTRAPDNLGPVQTSKHGDRDAFVAKIDTNSSGNTSLVYLTYFGGDGNDRGLAVVVDASQRAYVTGVTGLARNFPIKNAFQPTVAGLNDAFVAKFNANGSSLFYSTFLGSGANDEGHGIAIDSAGNAYVTGSTFGIFPKVNGLPSNFSGGNAFITKIEPENTGTTTPQKLYSDTFGGSSTEGNAIALDTKGNVYIAGSALGNLQTTPGVFQGANRGSTDAFVVKISSTFNDTIGVYRPTTGEWFLRNSNTAGTADISFTFGGQSGDQPIAGDWNGDGKDDVGVFRPATHQFLLRQPTIQLVRPCSTCPLIPTLVITTITINFGQSGDVAVVGDWNGDGIDTPGVFRPSTSQWLLTNSPNINNSSPAVDVTLFFGVPGFAPVTGDWNGDGIDTPGMVNLANEEWAITNSPNINNSAPTVDLDFFFGLGGDAPLSGDWNGDGVDTPATLRPNLLLRTGTFFFRNSNDTGFGDFAFAFGAPGDISVSGDWDGKPGDTAPNSGVNDPSEGSSLVGQTQVFTTTCSDPDGWKDIHTIDFKIAKSLGKGNGVPIILWLQFDQDRNVVRFYDPDTGLWSEGFIGAAIVLSSRFTELHLANTSVQGSGPTGPSVHVTWEVVFKEAAIGHNYKQYLQITDDSGLSTGFDKVGSWSVDR
jgi:Beta-propeller repeat